MHRGQRKRIATSSELRGSVQLLSILQAPGSAFPAWITFSPGACRIETLTFCANMSDTTLFDDLPKALAYLKPPAEDIANQDQDLIGCGEVDTTAFDTAIRNEMAALAPGDADILCAEHLSILNAWLKNHDRQDDPHVSALTVISALFSSAHEILNLAPDDEEAERLAPKFQPRLATIVLPDEFTINRFNHDIVASNGSIELVVREIDEKSFASLSQQFASPRRKTTTPDGTVIYPQSSFSLDDSAGTKNETEYKSTKEATYLLQSSLWLAMVRLRLPHGIDVSPYEAALNSIEFH